MTAPVSVNAEALHGIVAAHRPAGPKFRIVFSVGGVVVLSAVERFRDEAVAVDAAGRTAAHCRRYAGHEVTFAVSAVAGAA